MSPMRQAVCTNEWLRAVPGQERAPRRPATSPTVIGPAVGAVGGIDRQLLGIGRGHVVEPRSADDSDVGDRLVSALWMAFVMRAPLRR